MCPPVPCGDVEQYACEVFEGKGTLQLRSAGRQDISHIRWQIDHVRDVVAGMLIAAERNDTESNSPAPASGWRTPGWRSRNQDADRHGRVIGGRTRAGRSGSLPAGPCPPQSPRETGGWRSGSHSSGGGIGKAVLRSEGGSCHQRQPAWRRIDIAIQGEPGSRTTAGAARSRPAASACRPDQPAPAVLISVAVFTRRGPRFPAARVRCRGAPQAGAGVVSVPLVQWRRLSVAAVAGSRPQPPAEPTRREAGQGRTPPRCPCRAMVVAPGQPQVRPRPAPPDPIAFGGGWLPARRRGAVAAAVSPARTPRPSWRPRLASPPIRRPARRSRTPRWRSSRPGEPPPTDRARTPRGTRTPAAGGATRPTADGGPAARWPSPHACPCGVRRRRAATPFSCVSTMPA